MSEKQPKHQEYRDNLAYKLREIRNADGKDSKIAKARAEGYLEAKKEGVEYKKAKKGREKAKEEGQKLEARKKLEDDFQALKNNETLGHIFQNAKLIFFNDYQTQIDLPFDMKMDDLYLLENNQHILPDYFKQSITFGGIVGYDPSFDNSKYFEFKYNNKVGKWLIESHKRSQGAPLSSAVFKEHILPLQNVIEKIVQLKGISFNWKNDKSAPREIGLIAEEVNKIFPELVALDESGRPLGVYYDKMVAVLIEGIKELREEIDFLRKVQ